MKKSIAFSDVCHIISKLDTEESQNLYEYMKVNPTDEQRTRDTIITNAAYCRVLAEIYKFLED